MNDIDSPDYCEHNLGDERETSEEKEITRLTKLLTAARAERDAAVAERDKVTESFLDAEAKRILAVKAATTLRASLAAARADGERLLAEVKRIADEYHPLDDASAFLALNEMRSALTAAITAAMKGEGK